MKRGPEEQGLKSDGLKWLLVWVLVVGGVFSDWYFQSISDALKVAGGIVLFVMVLLAISWTKKGQIAWEFIKGARQELRRVHWQTRSEVLSVSIRVMLVVAVVTVVLWVVDSFFMWTIGLISR